MQAVKKAESEAREQEEGRDDKPDIRKIMAEIRARIQTDMYAFQDERPAFVASSPRDQSGDAWKAGHLLTSEELRYLNVNYLYGMHGDIDGIESHRKGIIGRCIVACKKRIFRFIWQGLLKKYAERERDFQANLVRYCNDISRYVDARDSSNFWDLIRKIDVDVNRAMQRIDTIADDTMAALESSEKRVQQRLGEMENALARLEPDRQTLDARLATTESVVAGMEGILARLGKTHAQAISDSGAPLEASPASSSLDPISDYSYLLLENRFRGSEEEIRRRMEGYVEMCSGRPGPVLEIGPGRGELLSLLREGGIPASGIDMDDAMVELCREKGLQVEKGDGLAHLASLPDASLGVIVAIQVIEHLPIRLREKLFQLAHQKLAIGGCIVLETINPKSLVALSSNYFRDPTHVWPEHPDTMAYNMELAGLRVVRTDYLSPVPEHALLPELPVEAYLPPRWSILLERLNESFKKLNGLLFGFQDYRVIAERKS